MAPRSPEQSPRLGARLTAAALAAALMLAACDAEPRPRRAGIEPYGEREPLGLMTSLPLYWPLGADVALLASGNAPLPWQRRAIEQRYRLVPLDTLSPISALSPGAPDTDPLAGLTRLAVIQPRGLAPADNVALDRWVRAGGRLLLVLDPALTGEYDLAFGDPRRPVDTALIPPVVQRWGLAVAFAADTDKADHPATAALPGGVDVPLALPGRIDMTDRQAADCALPHTAIAVCRVGRGRITLVADAALFEHPELAGADGAGLLAVLTRALE